MLLSYRGEKKEGPPSRKSRPPGPLAGDRRGSGELFVSLGGFTGVRVRTFSSTNDRNSSEKSQAK